MLGYLKARLGEASTHAAIAAAGTAALAAALGQTSWEAAAVAGAAALIPALVPDGAQSWLGIAARVLTAGAGRKAAILAPIVFVAGLAAACTVGQVQAGAAIVAAGCQQAVAAGADAKASLKGGALGTANHIVDNYVAPACGTAEAIATLAQDPSSAEWLAGLTGMLKAPPAP